MNSYRRTSDSIIFDISRAYEFTWDVEWKKVVDLAETPQDPVSLSPARAAQQITFEGLDPGTRYVFHMKLTKTGDEAPMEQFDVEVITLGDFKILDLDFKPIDPFVEVSSKTEVPAQVAVKSSNNETVYSDAEFGVDKSFHVGVADGRLKVVFTLPSGALKTFDCTVRPLAGFNRYTIPPFWRQMYDALSIMRSHSKDTHETLTSFLNMMKVQLRSTDFTAVGVEPLDPIQFQAFQDEVSYYYSMASKEDSVEMFVVKCMLWFMLYNVNDLDPTARPMSEAQKAGILQIIKALADQIVYKDTVSKLQNWIKNLNVQGLVAADSPFRTFYDQIASEPLPTVQPPTALDGLDYPVKIVELKEEKTFF